MLKQDRYRIAIVLLVFMYIFSRFIITPNSVILFLYAFVFYDVIAIVIFYISYLFKKKKLLLIGLVLQILAFNIPLVNLQLYYNDPLYYSDPLNVPFIEFKSKIDYLLMFLMIFGYLEVLGNKKINSILVVDNRKLIIFLLLSLAVFQTIFLYNMWF